eukprot:20007-Heterococcus_DN1.PRE.2
MHLYLQYHKALKCRHKFCSLALVHGAGALTAANTAGTVISCSNSNSDCLTAVEYYTLFNPYYCWCISADISVPALPTMLLLRLQLPGAAWLIHVYATANATTAGLHKSNSFQSMMLVGHSFMLTAHYCALQLTYSFNKLLLHTALFSVCAASSHSHDAHCLKATCWGILPAFGALCTARLLVYMVTGSSRCVVSQYTAYTAYSACSKCSTIATSQHSLHHSISVLYEAAYALLHSCVAMQLSLQQCCAE